MRDRYDREPLRVFRRDYAVLSDQDMDRWARSWRGHDYEDEVSGGGFSFVGPFLFTDSSTLSLSLVFAFRWV